MSKSINYVIFCKIRLLHKMLVKTSLQYLNSSDFQSYFTTYLPVFSYFLNCFQFCVFHSTLLWKILKWHLSNWLCLFLLILCLSQKPCIFSNISIFLVFRNSFVFSTLILLSIFTCLSEFPPWLVWKLCDSDFITKNSYF